MPMGLIESIMSTSNSPANVDDYPATALREAALLEGSGEVLHEWYEFEKYVSRRGDQLARHPDFRHLRSTHYVARKHALEIFPSEQDELSVEEIRRREIETFQDPLTVLPTTANTQTIDDYGSYGSEEWKPGSTNGSAAAQAGAHGSAPVTQPQTAAHSTLPSYSAVIASARKVFGPSRYSPDPWTSGSPAQEILRSHASVEPGSLHVESAAATALQEAPQPMRNLPTALGLTPGEQVAALSTAAGPAPAAVMTVAAPPSPQPEHPSQALRLQTGNLDHASAHATSSTGSPHRNAVSSSPRKARDSAHATPATSPVSPKAADNFVPPAASMLSEQPVSSEVQGQAMEGASFPDGPETRARVPNEQPVAHVIMAHDPRISVMKGVGFQVPIKTAKRPRAPADEDTQDRNESEPLAKRAKSATSPIESSKRPLAATEGDAEEFEQSQPQPKRAKIAAAPDDAVPRKIKGIAQPVKKSATTAPSKRAASKLAATEVSKRTPREPKSNLESVISGAALPKNRQEAEAASIERKARLLSAHLETKRSRPKRSPDLMPEFFEVANFPKDQLGDVVRCICGCEVDDGTKMVQCEKEGCEVWQHSKCMLPGLKKKQVEEYEGFLCQICGPWERRDVVKSMRRARKV